MSRSSSAGPLTPLYSHLQTHLQHIFYRLEDGMIERVVLMSTVKGMFVKLHKFQSGTMWEVLPTALR